GPAAATNYIEYAFGGSTANAQYGWSESAHRALTTNPNIGGTNGMLGNYNIPNGAHGSLVTNSFSLEGYKATDKPTLYFNYYLNTQGAASGANTMRDSARVFASIDGGNTWQMLATNNSQRNIGGGSELPRFHTTSDDEGRT